MKRTTILIALAIAAMLPLLQSCNNFNDAAVRLAKEEGRPRYLRDSDKWGKVVKKTYDLGNFNSIRTIGNIDVVYVQGESDETSILVEGNEKVLTLYYFKITGAEKNWLEVGAKDKKMIKQVPHIRVTVSMPILEAVEINGAGDFYMRQPTEFIDGALSLWINGAGDIKINDLSCTAFNVVINGAGDLDIDKLATDESIAFTINGAGDAYIKEAKTLGLASVAINGAGDFKSKIDCEDLKVSVLGAGEAKIEVKSQTVDAVAEGTGEIELKGTTHSFSKQTGGLAKIDSKKLQTDTIKR